MSKVFAIEDRIVALVVTTAKFRRPATPKRCSIKRYHVWRWKGGPVAPIGHRCQCGLLEYDRGISKSAGTL